MFHIHTLNFSIWGPCCKDKVSKCLVFSGIFLTQQYVRTKNRLPDCYGPSLRNTAWELSELRHESVTLMFVAVRLLGYSGLIQMSKLLVNGVLMIVIYSFLSLWVRYLGYSSDLEPFWQMKNSWLLRDTSTNREIVQYELLWWLHLELLSFV